MISQYQVRLFHIKKKSLLELLATLRDIDEDFPNVDEGLLL
jgi:hypothetical protein